MPNENLEKLVQAARDKKPTTFKQHLHAEIGTRVEAGVTEIRADLAKNMFASQPEITEHCEGAEVEHTHDDGTTHSHEEGGHPHTHGDDGEMIPEMDLSWQSKLGSNYDKKKDGRNAARKAKNDAKKKAGKKGKKDEEVTDEGNLPPALQKAIDAKKKNNSDDDDEDKSPVGKKDENLANFNGKKAKPFKKEDITDAAKKILDKKADLPHKITKEDSDKSEPGTQGDDAEYAKKRDAVLKKFGVKSCAALSTEEEKKACFKALDDAHVADHEE